MFAEAISPTNIPPELNMNGFFQEPWVAARKEKK
jgi:hypothetical protein